MWTKNGKRCLYDWIIGTTKLIQTNWLVLFCLWILNEILPLDGVSTKSFKLFVVKRDVICPEHSLHQLTCRCNCDPGNQVDCTAGPVAGRFLQAGSVVGSLISTVGNGGSNASVSGLLVNTSLTSHNRENQRVKSSRSHQGGGKYLRGFTTLDSSSRASDCVRNLTRGIRLTRNQRHNSSSALVNPTRPSVLGKSSKWQWGQKDVTLCICYTCMCVCLSLPQCVCTSMWAEYVSSKCSKWIAIQRQRGTALCCFVTGYSCLLIHSLSLSLFLFLTHQHTSSSLSLSLCSWLHFMWLPLLPCSYFSSSRFLPLFFSVICFSSLFTRSWLFFSLPVNLKCHSVVSSLSHIWESWRKRESRR